MSEVIMRCKEAIRLINNTADRSETTTWPPELLEHINNCPDCARAFKAISILNDSLKSEKEKPIQTTPMAEIRNRIAARIEKKKKESIMSVMKNHVNRRSGLVTSLSLAVIVFLLITVVPFSYTTTVGYDMVYTGLNGLNIEAGQLEQALAALGYENAAVEYNGDNCLITNLPNKQAALETAIAFKAITGSIIEPDMKPIMATVSGSLYAQVKDKIKVEVNTDGKTNDEIANDIRLKLTQFYTNPVVTVTTVGEGRKITITAGDTTAESGSGPAIAQRIELILNSDGDISFETPGQPDPRALEIDTKGKTDEEIKAEVEAKLAEQGEEGADVQVTTNADGKHEIRVKLEKGDSACCDSLK
jgi:hypothetical protein